MLCECGCGERTRLAPRTDRRKGWVKDQPMRYVFQHHNRSSAAEFAVHPLGCWFWQRYTDENGYGYTNRGGRCVMAHRAYYEDWVGLIPDGLVIDHLCRNPSCVNPLHLEPVTNAVNTQRGLRAVLTVERAREIRETIGGRACHKGTRLAQHLAARHGVSTAAIEHVAYGNRWRNA